MNHRIDVQALYKAFAAAARAAGESPSPVGERLGIDPATLTRLRRGQRKDIYASSLLAMCRWASLNPLDFLIEVAQPTEGAAT